MFNRIQLKKAVVYLSSDEIHSLLLQNIDLYKEALARGKAFGRNESLNSRIEAKRSEGL
jgi:hypothetical protein